jgi:hypothetical protein
VSFPDFTVTSEEYQAALSRGVVGPGSSGYARHSDGTLVPEGKPISNGPLARAFRLPSSMLPAGTPGAVVLGVNVAAWALVAVAVFRAFRR